MKRKLIAVLLLGLVSAQAGVALADNNDVFADPFWARGATTQSRADMKGEAKQEVKQPSGYELVDRFNP